MSAFGVLFRYYFRRNHGLPFLAGLFLATLATLPFIAPDPGQHRALSYLILSGGMLMIFVSPIFWYQRREDENLLTAFATRPQLERARLAAVLVQTVGLIVPVVVVGMIAGASVRYLPAVLAAFVVVFAIFSFLVATDSCLSRFWKWTFVGLSCATVALFLVAVAFDAIVFGGLAAIFAALALAALFASLSRKGDSKDAAGSARGHEEMLIYASAPPEPPSRSLEGVRVLVEAAQPSLAALAAQTRVPAAEAALPAEPVPVKLKTTPLLILLGANPVSMHAPVFVLFCLSLPSFGLLFFICMGAITGFCLRTPSLLRVLSSPQFLMTPARFRRGVFLRLALPAVIVGVAVCAFYSLPLSARLTHTPVRASVFRASEGSSETAYLIFGRHQDLVLWSSTNDTKDAPTVGDFNEFGVVADFDDDYVARQMATLLWNEYGVREVTLRKLPSDDEIVYGFDAKDSDRIDTAAVRERLFPVVVGVLVFLVLLNVAFRGRPGRSWAGRAYGALRPGLAAVLLLIAVTAFVFVCFRHDDLFLWTTGLDLTSAGDIARSDWGHVYAFVNEHWIAFLGVSAAASGFLYWSALRGFLMTDMASGVSLRAIFKRKGSSRETASNGRAS